MKRGAEDMPKSLKYFITDTGDQVHGYAGSIENEREEERIRRHYPRSVDRLFIGTYELVSVEEIPCK